MIRVGAVRLGGAAIRLRLREILRRRAEAERARREVEEDLALQAPAPVEND